jgi:hypothetical protein
MSRAEVLGCEFVTAKVSLPGGKSATVRELSAGERGKFFRLSKDAKDFAEIQAWLVAWCVVGDDGKRSFTDDDVASLMERPARVLQPIAEAVLKLSGLGDDEKKE